jgi:segregation and condensation protein B
MTGGFHPAKWHGLPPGAPDWTGRASGDEPGDAWRCEWRRRSRADRSPRISRAGEHADRSPRLSRLEAALFVTERPLSARRLAQHAVLADPGDVGELIDQLNAAYERAGAPFRVEHVATGYQLLTRPEFAPWLDKVHARHARLKLSPPALETLALVAYRQPVTRADIESVRGVQSGEMLKQLMERGLVRIAGEHDSLGRPYLYGTTRQFLELFGLHSLEDLPDADRLRAPAATSATVEAAGDEVEQSGDQDAELAA